ncbi:hypothetical protein [Knoellia sp. LjRoot47]|uniref:hypothetical protein n=1 Tax=Knoellia sp. LjRoot47 TaxID=3342330 RepID=UPI003ED02203
MRGSVAMEWDLGLKGLVVLAAIALGFGVVAGAAVGQGVRRRVRAVVVATAACFGVGALTSEVLFGWATADEMQPNVDGLSRDEVLLSSVLTTGLVVLVLHTVARRSAHERARRERRMRAVRAARR